MNLAHFDLVLVTAALASTPVDEINDRAQLKRRSYCRVA
jgi:hypothetical protein